MNETSSYDLTWGTASSLTWSVHSFIQSLNVCIHLRVDWAFTWGTTGQLWIMVQFKSSHTHRIMKASLDIRFIFEAVNVPMMAHTHLTHIISSVLTFTHLSIYRETHYQSYILKDDRISDVQFLPRTVMVMLAEALRFWIPSFAWHTYSPELDRVTFVMLRQERMLSEDRTSVKGSIFPTWGSEVWVSVKYHQPAAVKKELTAV